MKAIIWKELRENIKWGVLVSLAVGLAYTYFVSNYARNYSVYSRGADVLPTQFTAPIAGLLLGLLQILPELRRDQWAFLVHRPVPRAVLFQGKVIAGIAIYLGATLLPFGIAMFWLATSNRISMPFDWRYMLGGLADAAGGIVFYFAGILTAIRPARWYGSRATVIGVAVVCMIVMVDRPELGQALMAGASFGIILLPAALGCFCAKGEYHGLPKFSKIATGATLYLGNMICCCAAGALIVILFLSSQEPAARTTTQYEIDRSGRIVRATTTGGSIDKMTTLEGKPIPVPTLNPHIHGTQRPFLFQQSTSYFLKGSRPSFRLPSRYYVTLNGGTETADFIQWYYHVSDGLVKAYNSQYSRWEGYLTPDGFISHETKNALSSASRFGGELLNGGPRSISNLLAFRDGVYLCDFEKRQMVKLMGDETDDPILSAEELFIFTGYGKHPDFIVVFSQKWIRGFSPKGKPLFTAPMEYLDKGYEPRAISTAPKHDRWYIWYQPPVSPREQTLPSYITEVTRGKSVITRHTLPPLPWEHYESERQAALVGLLFGPGFVLSLTPLLGSGLSGIIVWILGWSVIAGFISIIPAYFVVRRYAFPKIVQWAWVFGVFLLGPFGILMLLLSVRVSRAQRMPVMREATRC